MIISLSLSLKSLVPTFNTIYSKLKCFGKAPLSIIQNKSIELIMGYKLRGSRGGKREKLKILIEKLQKRILSGRKPESGPANHYSEDLEDEVSGSTYVPPADVKEGHFAVIAVDHGEPKRFVVPINFLTHPPFLSLLEQAAEEYGFDHDGALTIPCRPSDLERILTEQWREERDERDERDPSTTVGFHWGSWKNTMVT